MSWFHFTKQDRLRRNREIRHEFAEEALKHTRDNVFLVPQKAEEALRIARDEEHVFADYFGEPMPAHMRRALQLEIAMWQHLIDAIQNAVKRPHSMTNEEYEALRNKVRAYLNPLRDLLLAEQEMLGSCLIHHYLKLVDALNDQATRAGL